MRKLLIVSHAPSTNSLAMAAAVARGAAHVDISDVEVRSLPALDAGPADVLWADGILLGSTENFGYMSGGMKDFFDRIYYPCLDQTQALPYALFIRAGNDGHGARTSMERIITGLRWKQVQPPLICAGAFREDFLGDCEELGMTMAAGLEAGIY